MILVPIDPVARCPFRSDDLVTLHTYCEKHPENTKAQAALKIIKHHVADDACMQKKGGYTLLQYNQTKALLYH